MRADSDIVTTGDPGEVPRLFDPDGPLVPVEINLEELPIFLFQVRGRTAQKTIETKDTVLLDSGERLEKYFKITGSEEFGLPGPSDRDVYLAVVRLMQRSGGMPPDGRVGFSLYEIIKILGLTGGSKNYLNIRRSIDRIGATLVYAENGFYNREGGIFETHRFQPWRPFMRQTRSRGTRSERHVVRFDELLVGSYRSNYLKTLDADFHFSLGNDLAKLLYGLIDVRRMGTLAYSEEIHQLRRLIPLPDSYYQPSRIKRRLGPAYRELLRRGFLTRVDYEDNGSTETVRHRISPVFVQQREAFSAGLPRFEREVLERLICVGVWPAKARELIISHGAEHCETFLEALPLQRRLRNPAAWLVQAIEKDWRNALGGAVPSTSDLPEKHPTALEVNLPLDLSPSPRQRSESSQPSADPSTSPDPQHPREDVRRRLEAGEFEAAIETWESISYTDYKKFVAAARPVQADDTNNRYYVSLEGELYLCLDENSVAEEQRVYICTLKRSLP